jgi:hypothetical protein
MQFQTAQREAIRTILSVAGKSGSGKTYSSLLLARGLVGPEGKIFMLDTEAKRSRMYAEDEAIGGFTVGDMYPPFTPDSFIAAIDAAEQAGADVIVIDSMSHEWNGIGGCLEWAEQIQEQSKKRGPTAWIKPKMAHRRMVNRLLQAQCHIVVCLRAEFKMVSYTDDRGRQAFAESADLVPEQQKNFIYEMTASAIIDPDHTVRWVKLPKPLHGKLANGQRISVETGEAIRAWTEGGAMIDKELERQKAICRDLASMGEAALRRHWDTLPKELKAKLKPAMDAEFKPIAQRADDQAETMGEPEQPEEEAL